MGISINLSKESSLDKTIVLRTNDDRFMRFLARALIEHRKDTDTSTVIYEVNEQDEAEINMFVGSDKILNEEVITGKL
jgi:hypothetical protein